MPFRLPAFLQESPGPDPDTSRRWLWLALLTGLLALALALGLASSALSQRLAHPPGSAAGESARPLPTPNQSQNTPF